MTSSSATCCRWCELEHANEYPDKLINTMKDLGIFGLAIRYFRDAPLMIVGEGTNEIQRNVIVAQLVERGLGV